MSFFTAENRNEKRKWATNEEARVERKRANFGPREAKMMANLVAKYNTQNEMLDALNDLNLTSNMKHKFFMDILMKYKNLNANVTS